MTREMIKAQYLIMGGFFFVLGYGLHFYLRWCPTVVSTEHLWLEFIHGTIMVFFGIVPAAFLGLSYHVITPVRGSQMFFPQLDRIALFLFYPSALLILIAILLPGMLVLNVAMSLNFAATMICCINFVATVLSFPAQTTEFINLRSVKWTLFVLSFFIFADFLLLENATFLQMEARLVHSDPGWIYYPPEEPPLPLFWKHVFWFMGHPEVIIILLLLIGFFMDGLRFIFRRLIA